MTKARWSYCSYLFSTPEMTLPSAPIFAALLRSCSIDALALKPKLPVILYLSSGGTLDFSIFTFGALLCPNDDHI